MQVGAIPLFFLRTAVDCLSHQNCATSRL